MIEDQLNSGQHELDSEVKIYGVIITAALVVAVFCYRKIRQEHFLSPLQEKICLLGLFHPILTGIKIYCAVPEKYAYTFFEFLWFPFLYLLCARGIIFLYYGKIRLPSPRTFSEGTGLLLLFIYAVYTVYTAFHPTLDHVPILPYMSIFTWGSAVVGWYVPHPLNEEQNTPSQKDE